jgi:hypothetical protein
MRGERNKTLGGCSCGSSAKTKSRVIVVRVQSLSSDQSLSLQRRLHTSGRSDTGRLQALSVQLELRSISWVSTTRGFFFPGSSLSSTSMEKIPSRNRQIVHEQNADKSICPVRLAFQNSVTDQATYCQITTLTLLLCKVSD